MNALTEAVSRGRQARQEGRLFVAREHYAEAAWLSRGQGDVLSYAHAIRHIADIYQEEHNGTRALALYEEALALYRGRLDTRLLDLANTVRPYALLMEEQGKTDLAIELWDEARVLYGSLRISDGVAECERHLSDLQGYS